MTRKPISHTSRFAQVRLMVAGCLMVAATSVASPTPSKPKLFLFAGQSNMVGIGDWSSLTAAEIASVSNAWVFTADPGHAPPLASPTYFQYWLPPQGVFGNFAQWTYAGKSWCGMNPVQYNTLNNFGPELTAVRDLSSGLGEQVYFAKYALGGTGLDASFGTLYGTWNPAAADPGSPAEYTQSLYHSMVSWSNKALAAARQIHPDTELAGFFWLQGESDAAASGTANRYATNLTNFVQHLRTDLGSANLPLVIGRITNKSSTMPAANTVRSAQASVVNATTNAVLVDTDGLPMDPTYQLHYLDAGLKTVGERFAAAWLNLNRPPAVNNGSGATSVLASSATLNGNLVATGGATTTVTIFWGTADGGVDNTAWGHSVNLGTRAAGAFTTNISGLVAGSMYYYRCRTQNSYGETWSGATVPFLALPGSVPPAPVVGSNSPVNQGAAVTLTASSPYTTDPNAFIWNGPSLTNAAGNNLSFTNAQPAWSGSYACTVTVNGITSPAASVTVTVNALPVTSAITGNSLVQAGQSGVTYAVTATSGSSYAWSVPSGATITAGSSGPGNNRITVTFGGNAGNVSVVETNATGGIGAPVSMAVDVNHAPVCSNLFVWSQGGAAQTIAIIGGPQAPQDVDAVDAGKLTVTGVGSAGHGATALSADHKGVTYTPNTGFTGAADPFTYTVSDGRGGSGTAMVTVGVGSVGQAQGITRNAGGITLSFKGVPGLPFTVERALDPGFSVNLTTLGSRTADSVTGWFSITDGSPPKPNAFYRARYP